MVNNFLVDVWTRIFEHHITCSPAQRSCLLFFHSEHPQLPLQDLRGLREAMEGSVCTGIHKRETERYRRNQTLTLPNHTEKIRLFCMPRLSCLTSQRVWHDTNFESILAYSIKTCYRFKSSYMAVAV